MENQGTCFVIQPFDGAVYDKRFRDIFGPAIRSAGLEPYRVDEDPRVSVPIDEIEEGIRRATICFAEISTDNPNVWFELGFAIACRKEVILVCSEERQKRFPFDVQHRTIITYKSEAPSDYTVLAKRITERMVAALDKQLAIGNVAAMSPVKTTEGLSAHEVVCLVAVAKNTDSAEDVIPAHLVREDMRKAGFTDIAVTLAATSLVRKQLIESRMEQDYNANEYAVYRVTDLGMEWLAAHEDQLILRRDPPLMSKSDYSEFESDELPF